MPRPIHDLNLPDLSIFFGDLVGGVDLNSSPTALPPGKSQELLNYSLEEGGALLSLEGWVRYTDTPLGPSGEDRIQGGNRVYLVDPFTIVSYDGGVYTVDSGGAFSALLTTVDPNAEVYFPYDGKVMLVLDGANRPQVTTDGANFYDLGIDAPGSAPTLSLTAGGSLIDTDEYEVSYTFGTSASFDPNLVHESNESDTDSIVVANPDKTIQVQGFGSDDPKVDTIYIYARNLTTGQALRRQVATTANTDSVTPWTASFSIEPNDISLAPPTDNDVPVNLSFAFFFKNRWWAFDPNVRNRLRFSEVFQVQTWPADYFIDLPMTFGDGLAAMQDLGDTLTLFGKTGVYLLTGPTTLEIDVRPALSYETGAFGPRAVQKVEAGIVHAGNAGVFLFNGAQDQDVSRDIRKGWRDLVGGATALQLARVAMIYLPRLSQLFIAVPRLYPYGEVGEYQLDFLRMAARKSEAWTKTDRDVVGYFAFLGNEPIAADYGKLFSWPTLGGVINRERNGEFTANGDNIEAVFTTPAQNTQFRETMLVNGFIEYQPADGNLTLDLYVNGNLVNTQVFPLNEALAVYGTAEYGVAVYGSAGRRKLALMFPLPADGTEFYLTLTYSGTSRFKVYSWGVGTVPEPVLRTL